MTTLPSTGFLWLLGLWLLALPVSEAAANEDNQPILLFPDPQVDVAQVRAKQLLARIFRREGIDIGVHVRRVSAISGGGAPDGVIQAGACALCRPSQARQMYLGRIVTSTRPGQEVPGSKGPTVRAITSRWQPPTSNTGVLIEDGDQVEPPAPGPAPQLPGDNAGTFDFEITPGLQFDEQVRPTIGIGGGAKVAIDDHLLGREAR